MMKKLRANCKTLRRVKSPFWHLLSQRRLFYFLKYVFAAGGRTCLQVLTRSCQNLRFSAGVEFCNWLLLLIFFPFLLNAGTIRLINNSPYDLRTVIRGADGSFLGELVVRSQQETVWTDTYGQFGLYGGANPNANQNYLSKTPYTVLWYCLDGADYAVCDTVSTGALVTAQSCNGARMCKPNKRDVYPQEPSGQYLYKVPKSPPLNQ